MLRYLAELDFRRRILWCAFIWYAVLVVRHGCADTRLWLQSLGLAVFVGAILTLNAVPLGGAGCAKPGGKKQ